VRDTLILQVGKFGVIGLGALSSLMVWRLLQPEAFGVYATAESFLALWHTLDLTGVGTALNTRLGLAIGARQPEEVLDVMAFFVKVSTVVQVSIALLIGVLGAGVAASLYDNPQIGLIAAGLGVASIADALYGMLTTTFLARRRMSTLAALLIANQGALALCMIGAAVISPTPISLLIGRLIYSYGTLIMAIIVYSRARDAIDGEEMAFPALPDVIRHMWRAPVRKYLRFGAANAIDKNLATLYIQLPTQITALVSGSAAVGYLNFALSAIVQAGVLMSAIFDNLQAVVPQAVGRGDYAALWRNFGRILAALAIGGAVFFGVVGLVSPAIVPWVLGPEWIPAVPALITLTFYGALTTAGGVFGPLYRALDIMGAALFAKIVPLITVLPIGAAILLSTPGLSDQAAAVGGGWMINCLFIGSVTITGMLTLRELRRRARSTGGTSQSA